jgi:nucleotide-binding universal stress UspA family protein
MKNILVTTDFSKPANNAAIFAAELAKFAGARLVLFHAYHPGILLEEETIWADSKMLENEVQEKIDQLAHELHKTFGVSVTRVLKPGFAVDEILEISKKVKADLLIIGTHGAGKRPKTGPGKICTEVLKKADLPVICLNPEITLELLRGERTDLNENKLDGNPEGLALLTSVISTDLPQPSPAVTIA